MADETNLGELKKTYRASIGYVGIGFFFSLTVFAGAALCGYAAVQYWQRGNVRLGDRNTALILGAVGVSLVLFGFWLYTKYYRLAVKRVLVFSDGFVEINHLGSNVFPWDAIVSVRQRSYLLRGVDYHSFEVFRNDRVHVELNDVFGDIVMLGTLIHSETASRLLPAALERCQSGGEIPFGSIRVTQAGLNREDGAIAWQEVADVKIDRGLIDVYQQKGSSTTLWTRL